MINYNYNNDLPIQNSKEDLLNRAEFAENLATAVSNLPTQNNSFTIGLIGEWGSGKSSILNMFEEKIKNKEKIIIMKFNPWRFSQMDNLYNSFFTDLIITLEKNNINKDIINKLKKYKDKIILSSLHILKDVAHVSAPLEIYKMFNKDDKTLEEQKNDLNKILSVINKKVVIIIDDIDRLVSKEVQQLFQIIKSLADFPNITYLLSFDKNHVYNALNTNQFLGNNNVNKNSEQFLNKIIQMPINIPKINSEDLKTFAEKRITTIFTLYSENIKEKELYNLIKYNVPFMKNLRDLNRYINLLTFNFASLHNKVNLYDLSLLSILQLFDNNIYTIIKNNKQLFNPILLNDKTKKEISKILKNTSEPTKSIIFELFPVINNEFNHIKYYPDKNGNLRKISNRDYFDTYFSFNLDSKKLSKTEQNEIINISKNKKELTKKLILLHEKDQLSSFLINLEGTPKEINENLVYCLITLNNIIDIYYSDYIITIVQEFIKESTASYNIIKKGLNESKSLLFNLYLVDELQKNESLQDNKKHELKEIVKEKCLSDISNFNIPKEDMYTFLSYVEPLKIANELYSNEDNNELIYKLYSFIRVESHFGESHKKFELKHMEKYYDKEIIKDKLEKIKKNNNPLYENNKDLFGLFEKSYNENHIK